MTENVAYQLRRGTDLHLARSVRVPENMAPKIGCRDTCRSSMLDQLMSNCR
jgi:hypothetical protein